MKKLICASIIVVLLAALGACKGEKADASADAVHNSRNSLNWEGVYEGLVPGANSDIKTELTLNSDGTFTLITQYVDKSAEIYTDTGTFTWDKDGGVVKLDIENTPPYYRVGENKLIQLDMEGKVITGDMANNYILTKKN